VSRLSLRNEKEKKVEAKAGSSDKKRYKPIKRELLGKTPSDIRKEKLEKMRAKKVCHPKRPISSFFFFTIDNRKKIYTETPDISFKNIAAVSAEDWKKLTPE